MQAQLKPPSIQAGGMSESKIERVAERVINYYAKLGKGDELRGVKLAKDMAVRRLIDLILSSDKADQELKNGAFFTMASLDFLESYEKITLEQ